MKKYTPCLVVPAILLILTLISCDKNPSSDETGLKGPIIHKWNIVRHVDTTITLMAGIWYLDYKGTGNDYIDFNKNGTMYTYENGVRDTASFEITSGSGPIEIQRTNHVPYNSTYKVEVLTEDSLQLSAYETHFAGSHDYRLVHYYLNR